MIIYSFAIHPILCYLITMKAIAQRMHVVADFLTFFRFIDAILILSAANTAFIASILVTAGWASDMLDGMIARKYGGTKLGGLDLYADLCFDISILYFLLSRNAISWVTVLIVSVVFIGAYFILHNDAPLMLWMALIYFAFIVYTYTRDKTAFYIVAGWAILTPILSPRRSLSQIKHFFKEIGNFI